MNGVQSTKFHEMRVISYYDLKFTAIKIGPKRWWIKDLPAGTLRELRKRVQYVWLQREMGYLRER